MHLANMQFLPKSLFVCTLLTTCFRIVRADAHCQGGGDGSRAAYSITVDKSSGKFRTVQSAIDAIPAYNDRWIKIYINPGTYTEQVTIPKEKPCIILEGRSRRDTIITYDAHERTDTSATFSSFADYVVAKRITFQNSYNIAHELMLLEMRIISGRIASFGITRRDLDTILTDLRAKEAGKAITQAVAARIYGDKSAFYACGFVGVQDTLWDVQGRHFFSNCYIEGAVDFIFGEGQSIYEHCSLNSTVGSTFNRGVIGYITAQHRQSSEDSNGFIFRGGSVTGNGQIYLGRAYGPYSRVIFFDTWLSSVVTPSGWNAAHFQGKEGKFVYAEVECTGPGSDTSQRVPWLKKFDHGDLYQFSTSNFINQDGWLNYLPE